MAKKVVYKSKKSRCRLSQGMYVMFEHENKLVATLVDSVDKDEVMVSFCVNKVLIRRNVHKNCIIAIKNINGVHIPNFKGNWEIIDILIVKKHYPKF